MNRKSQKLYTLALSGPQVRALSLIADWGYSTFVWIGPNASVTERTAHRALEELDAVLWKVKEDEKP